MGRFYLDEMKKSGRWDIAYICDINPQAREAAKSLSPESNVVDDENIVFEDESVEAVGLCTLANYREKQVEKGLRHGKDIMS